MRISDWSSDVCSSDLILSKDEGGRHTPFFQGYRPQFYFRTTDVTVTIELPADKEMVLQGDNVSMKVSLIAPIAMEEGLRFAIREGGRTVGAGVVASITTEFTCSGRRPLAPCLSFFSNSNETQE